MNQESSLVRNISDTARWVAHFRALETQRPDALFRDPYAERLAGERGFSIANNLPEGNKHDWAWAARTYLFDKFLFRQIQQGADLVLNLAAGLDARPYRMQLANTLRWVEVDLPEIVAYKEEILGDEKPACTLERTSLDLTDLDARRSLFAELSQRASRIVVLTEGLLIYLSADEVASLASDLAYGSPFQSWIIDLASPGQLRWMQRTMGRQLGEAGAPLKFAPPDGANFFAPYGWKATEIQGLLKTAAQFKRPPTELLSLLPEPQGLPGNFPWTGACLLERHDGLQFRKQQ